MLNAAIDLLGIAAELLEQVGASDSSEMNIRERKGTRGSCVTLPYITGIERHVRRQREQLEEKIGCGKGCGGLIMRLLKPCDRCGCDEVNIHEV